MIIETILDVILAILTKLLSVLPSLPQLPSTILSVWSDVVTLLGQGISFIGNWIYLPVALPCLGLILAVNMWEDVYGLIKWFVSKIPFLNIRL